MPKKRTIDAKSHREIISNPRSWYQTADMLYQNADALYGIYAEQRKREIEGINRCINCLQVDTYAALARATTKEPCRSCFQSWLHSPLPPHTPSYLETIPVYMMLMGMAIENIVKGIGVARKLKDDITKIDRATLSNLGIFGHTAPEMLDDLGIAIHDYERKLLEDANEHLVWAGRYATPAKESIEILSETVMHSTPAELDEEEAFEKLMALYRRLVDILDKEVSDPTLENWCMNHQTYII